MELIPTPKFGLVSSTLPWSRNPVVPTRVHGRSQRTWQLRAPAMSRGIGRLQRQALELLAHAPLALSLLELRGELYGWRPTRRGVPLAGRSGSWSPIRRDDRRLRRALAGLERRGLIVLEHERPLGWKRSPANLRDHSDRTDSSGQHRGGRMTLRRPSRPEFEPPVAPTAVVCPDCGAAFLLPGPAANPNHEPAVPIAEAASAEARTEVTRIAQHSPETLLPTKLAAAYCHFASSSALRKAQLEGKVSAAGRRGGGRGTYVWRVRDLDAFLVGRRPHDSLRTGRSGAPPATAGGGHEQEEAELGHALENGDCRRADAAGDLAAKERRISRAGARDRSAGRPAEGGEKGSTVEDEGAAYQWLQQELERIRLGNAEAPKQKPRFSSFAAQLFERKIDSGNLKSAASREKWRSVLEHHLIPAFGEFFVDQLGYADIEAWQTEMAKLVQQDQLSPHTVNDWIAVLRVIVSAFVREFRLAENPIDGIRNLDTSEHPTYTEEQPNSLTPDETRAFIGQMVETEPDHYAMTALGFATGLRPSSMRPLRRKGPTPDVLWEENAILVRRSNTRGKEVMNTTKTKKRQRIELPKELMDVLKWHVERLPEGPMHDSELLFPSETGGFRSRSVLDKPFSAVAAAIKLKKRFTPRGMRRTFQDLARAAEVRDVVTRAISGHATEAMHLHYSSVQHAEVREAVAKVIELAGIRATAAATTAAVELESVTSTLGASKAANDSGG